MISTYFKIFIPILIFIFHISTFAQVTPGSAPKSKKSHEISLDTLIFINHTIAPVFMSSNLSLISPSTASPLYYTQHGFPVFADTKADPVTGKFNYQQLAPSTYLKLPDSSSLSKPYTDIFYKEGGYEDTRLTLYQWLPLNNNQKITIKINSHKSYSEYYKANKKEQIANIDLNYYKQLSEKSEIKAGFLYFRNVGTDFTGTRPIPSIGYNSSFPKNNFEDYYRKYSLAYTYSDLKITLEYSNIKNKANDVFYKSVNSTTADTISRNIEIDQEKISIHSDYKINPNISIGINAQNFSVYKSKTFPTFKHYYLESYLKGDYFGFSGILKMKKADHFSLMFDADVSKTVQFSKQSLLTTNIYYKTFMLPYSYLYLLANPNFDYDSWQKIAGGKTNLKTQINKHWQFSGYGWINNPVNYYSQFYINEYKKNDDIYYGLGVSLKLLTRYFNNEIFYEKFSPFGSDYIQKVGCKSKLDLKLSKNIRITGYALLAYYLNYQRTSYLYTTNEFHLYSTKENPVISNLYLTLPVKSSILFAEWSNVFQQDYAFKNYDYFSFVTFKFGVIWRLWE